MRQTLLTPADTAGRCAVGPRPRAAPPGGRRNVRRQDGAARARAAERAQVHSALGRQPPRLRRRRGDAAGARRCRPTASGSRRRRARRPSRSRPLGGLDRREIDAVLLGDLPGQRRRLHAAGGGRRLADRSGRRRCRHRPGSGGSRRGARGSARLPGREDQRDRLAHRHHVARLRGHLTQDTGRGRLDLDRDLVRLDLDDRLALA